MNGYHLKLGKNEYVTNQYVIKIVIEKWGISEDEGNIDISMDSKSLLGLIVVFSRQIPTREVLS